MPCCCGCACTIMPEQRAWLDPFQGHAWVHKRCVAGARSCATTPTPARPCGSTRALYVSSAATRCTHKVASKSPSMHTHEKNGGKRVQTNQNRREHACGGRRARARRPRWRRPPPEHRRACAAGRHSIRWFPELAARACSARTRARPRAGAAGGAALDQCARAKRRAIRQAPIRMPRRVGARGSVRAREAAGDEAGADQDAAAGPAERAQLGLAAVHRQAQQDGEQRVNRQDHLPRAPRPRQPPRPSAPKSVARAPAPCSRASCFRFASGFMPAVRLAACLLGTLPNPTCVQPGLVSAGHCDTGTARSTAKIRQPLKARSAHLRLHINYYSPLLACLPRDRAPNSPAAHTTYEPQAGRACPAVALIRACAASCAISPVLKGPAPRAARLQDSGHATERARPQRCTPPLTSTSRGSSATCSLITRTVA